MAELERLDQKHCIPCEGGTLPLSEEKAHQLLSELEHGWTLESGKLAKRFKFHDFREAIEFVNEVANLAEAEGHHPDLTINYNRVRVELSTHSIGGLSDNDFIVAAKIEQLLPRVPAR